MADQQPPEKQPPEKKSRREARKKRQLLDSPTNPSLPQHLPLAHSQDVSKFGPQNAVPVVRPSKVFLPRTAEKEIVHPMPSTSQTGISQSFEDVNFNAATNTESFSAAISAGPNTPLLVPSAAISAAELSAPLLVPYSRTPVLIPPINFHQSYYPEVPLTLPLHKGSSLNWEYFLNIPLLHSDYSYSRVPLFPITFCMETPDTEPELAPGMNPLPLHESPEDKLYEGCTLSVYDSMVSILAFSQSSQLSGANFCKLLDLFHVVLPKPCKLPTSKHLFFKNFQSDDSQMQLVHYCNVCWKFRKNMKDVCTCKGSCVKYFIKCSIESQLRKMFSRPGFVEKLRHRHSRKKVDANNIEDIFDSTVYKLAEENLLVNDLCVSLTWYTDGVALYECSSYSLWPFVFVINELPLSERFKPENLILGGLWGDGEKPHPNIFLLPMYEELSKLKNGFNVKLHGCEEECEARAFVITGTCDVPAKACFMCMKGHSGYHSCPKCFIRGEKSDRTGDVMAFPHQDELELRNHENYLECLDRCVTSKQEYLGVDGPSMLSHILSSSVIDSVSIDSMHCLFIGVTKSLLRLWFDPKYHKAPFSLKTKANQVNLLLRNLKLPHFVQRLPEDVTKLGFWKASLCRNFLLYMPDPK
ncbi:Flap endonuclease 1 [Frankliniella fusca]|uniref:Flap endonuclease 1 n=1 Tax=Frankliniella fusca TaxID=407009 RepID=A0AAE1HVN4_9NEOP|nr:Flap endonuclease 1 [Frankliniella fusca]